MGPETDEMVQFLDQETDRKLLYLGPEIVKMVQQYFWTHKLTKWFRVWTQKLYPGIVYLPSDFSCPFLPKLETFSEGSCPITLALSTSSRSSIYISSQPLPVTLELQQESRAAAPLASRVN